MRINSYYFEFKLYPTFNLFTFLKRTNSVLNIFSDYFCGQILAQIQDHKKSKNLEIEFHDKKLPSMMIKLPVFV